MLGYLDFPDTKIESSPYRRINSLEKYETIEPHIIPKALRIIANHYEESPLVFGLYVFDILNHSNQRDIEETLKKFSGELPLLEEIYLKGISYPDYKDYDGTLLFAIIYVDRSFLYRYLDQLIEIWKSTRHNSTYDTERLLKVWDTEQYIEYADMIFDHLHKKKDQIFWYYDSPLSEMLYSQSNHPEIIPKQDLWIEHTIERYSVDGDRMYELFSAIEELPQERRKRAVEKFLSLNADPDVFEKLPLESSSWGGSGSMIPYMQARVDYLSSLLPSVSGLKYLQQKQRIKRDIENWKARIRAEEIEELLVDWYH